MSLLLDLPAELETELSAEAAQLGLPLAEYALRLLATGRHADAPPTSGADVVAYWQREGLVGSRSDIVDAPAHVRTLRQQANR